MRVTPSPLHRSDMPAFIQQDHLRFPPDWEEPKNIRIFRKSPLNGFTVKRCSYMSLVYKSMFPNLESSPWESEDSELPFATTLPGRYVINSVSESSQNTPPCKSSFIKTPRSHSSSASLRSAISDVASTNRFPVQESDKNFHTQNLSGNASRADAEGKPRVEKVVRTEGRFFRSASLSSTSSPRINYYPEPRVSALQKQVALQPQLQPKPSAVKDNYNLFGQSFTDSFSRHDGMKSSYYGSDEDSREWSSSKERRSRARQRDKPPYGEGKHNPTPAREKVSNKKTTSVPADGSHALRTQLYSHPDTRSSSFLRRFAGLVARLVLSDKLEGSVIDPQGRMPQIAQYRVPCSLRWHPGTRDVFGQCEAGEDTEDKTSAVVCVTTSVAAMNKDDVSLSDNDNCRGDLEESKDSRIDQMCSESATLVVAVPLDTNSNKDYSESSDMNISESAKRSCKCSGDCVDVLRNHEGELFDSASIEPGGENDVVGEAGSFKVKDIPEQPNEGNDIHEQPNEVKDIPEQPNGLSSNELTDIKSEDSCQDHEKAFTIEGGLEDHESSDDASTSEIDCPLSHGQLTEADLLESETSSMEPDENLDKTENNERGRTPAHEHSHVDRLDIGGVEEDVTSCTGSLLTQSTHPEVELANSSGSILSVQSMFPVKASLFTEASEGSKRDENSSMVNHVDSISEGEESGSSSEDEDSQVELVHGASSEGKMSSRVSPTDNKSDYSQSITGDTTDASSRQTEEDEGTKKRGVVRVRSVRDTLYKLGDVRRKSKREVMPGRNYRICKPDHMENFYWNSITWRIRENWPQNVHHRKGSTSPAPSKLDASSRKSPSSIWREKNKLSPSPRERKEIAKIQRLKSVSPEKGSDKIKFTRVESKKDDISNRQNDNLESDERFKKETHPLGRLTEDPRPTRQSVPQAMDKESPGKGRGEEKFMYLDARLSSPASTHQSNEKAGIDISNSDTAGLKDDSIHSGSFSHADEMLKTKVSPSEVAVVQSGIVGSIVFDDMLDENLDQISSEHLLRSRTERHTRPRLSEQPQRVESAHSPTHIPADKTTVPSPERKEENYKPFLALALYDGEQGQGTVAKVEDRGYQKEESPCRICPPETAEEPSDEIAEKHHTEKLEETTVETSKEFIEKVKTRFWSQSIRNWSWPFLSKRKLTQKATVDEKIREKGEPQPREYLLKKTEDVESRDDNEKGKGDIHTKGSKPCLICPIEEENDEELGIVGEIELGDVGEIEIEIDLNEELHDVEIQAPCSICPPDEKAHSNHQAEDPAPDFKPCLVCPDDEENIPQKSTIDVTQGRRGYLPKSDSPRTNEVRAIKTGGKSSHRRVVKEVSLNYDRDRVIFVEEVLAPTPPEQREDAIQELPSNLDQPEPEQVEETHQEQSLVLPQEDNDKSPVDPPKRSPGGKDFKNKDLKIPRYKVVNKIARHSGSSAGRETGKAGQDKAELGGSSSEAADTLVFLERSAQAAAIFTDVINDYKTSFLDPGSVLSANSEHKSTLSYIRQRILEELERFSARNVKTAFEVPDKTGLMEPPEATPIYLSRRTVDNMERYLGIDLSSWFYPATYTVCTESSSKDSVQAPVEAAGDQHPKEARNEIKPPASPAAEIQQELTESEHAENFVDNDRELTFYRPVVPMDTFTDAKCRCRHCRKNLRNKLKRDAQDDDPSCTAAEVGQGGSEVCRRLVRGSDQKQMCGGSAVFRRHQHGSDGMDPWAHSELDRQSVVKTNRRIYADRFYRRKLTVRNILSLCSERTPGGHSWSKSADSWKGNKKNSDGEAVDLTEVPKEIKDSPKSLKWSCGGEKGELSGKTTDARSVCAVRCDDIISAGRCVRAPLVQPCCLGSRVNKFLQAPIDKMVFSQQDRELVSSNTRQADCDAAKKTEQRLSGANCVWSARADAAAEIPQKGKYVGQTRHREEYIGQTRHGREHADPLTTKRGGEVYSQLNAQNISACSPTAKPLSLETCWNCLAQPAVDPYSPSSICQKPLWNYSSSGCFSLERSLQSGSSFCDFLSQMYRECSSISRVGSYANTPVQRYDPHCRLPHSLVPSCSTDTLASCVYRPADSSRMCSKTFCPGCYVTTPRLGLVSGKAPCFSMHQYV